MNLSTVTSNFNKAQLLDYLFSGYIPSNSPIETFVSSANKSYIDNRLTYYLDHLITVFSSNANLDTVFTGFSTKYSYFRKHCFPQNMLSYEPNDFKIIDGGEKHLTYIKADKAWDKHRADSRIRIGFSDTYLDTLHEDLKANISQVLTNVMPTTETFHGTAVAGCLSAITNNNIGLSSVAGNSKLVFSSNWGDNDEVRLIARQNRVRVVNLSWFNRCVYDPDQDSFYRFIEDTLNLVVVSAAGNNNTHCGSKTAQVYPAALPSVICVTSVCHSNPPGYICQYVNPPRACLIEDRHEVYPGDTNSTFHHYPEVDICAPGYHPATTHFDNTGLHNQYISGFGTSFASPIVASACALVASFNPCLTARQIRNIIIQSANPSILTIPENIKYTGLLGSGKLDVNEALNRAENLSTRYEQNINYNVNQNITNFKITAGHHVTTGTQGNVNVNNNANIIYNVHHSVELNDGFEVKNGTFEVRFTESPCY